MKITVEFEYNIGDKITIPGLNDTIGYVVSLWYSDKGPKYEVVYYCASERNEGYFMPVELKPCNNKKDMGFKKEKK